MGSFAHSLKQMESIKMQLSIKQVLMERDELSEEEALETIAEANLTGRIGTKPGDFFAEPNFPVGRDVILLSMIMHDWSEDEDLAILRKCYEALPPGGAVVISELLVNDEKTGPAPAALMSLNMLIETIGGRNYTPAEYRVWLENIGFRDVRVLWFEAAGANGALIGYKRNE